MSPRIRNLFLTSTALVTFGALPGAAGPDGAVVTGGSATVQGQGTASVIINQNTDRAIINWNTFNIGTNESARFNQPSASSVTLNRVVGGLGPSMIDGTLTANGRVFVINRDGMLFGPNAVINTAGFLATTSDIKNKDFMAGRYNFNRPGAPDASIVNLGHITATNGGFAALVAPGVRNSGTITATLGTVALASGNMYTLDLYGDRLIQLGLGDHTAGKVVDVATGQPLTSLVSNDGKLKANGGRVELTAAAARHVVDSVINNTGVIEANSVGRHNGMIVIGAATGASKGAGAPTQTVRLSGRISAAGNRTNSKGGTIVVTGEDIRLEGARIEASGQAGGGRVLIGGDWGGGTPTSGLVNNASARLEGFGVPTATTVSVDAATTINASAKASGDGGKVILWSDTRTTFAGTIFANGGASAGNGGFVETSSHGLLNYAGIVDLRAPNGVAGTLLLDPYNVTISAGTTTSGSFSSGGVWTPNANGSTINVSTLVTQLGLGNVVVTTNGAGTEAGNINVNANVTWSSNNSLTLSAFHDINIAAGVVVANTLNASGNLILRADNTGTGSGTVNFPMGIGLDCICAPLPPGKIDFTQSTGTVSIYYNPSLPISVGGLTKYQNPTLFTPNVLTNPLVNSQFTAYMLVNNGPDLQAIGSNLSGNYALGRDIDATGFVAFGPGANFLGRFDGSGGLGSNQTISNLTIAAGTGPMGLFPVIGTGAVVENLDLAKVNITATNNLLFLGSLTGMNLGTVRNVNVRSGSVNGGTFNGIFAGGLVGVNQNQGTITGSSSAANVTLGDGSFNNGFNGAGGLVGLNQGMIAGSSASGIMVVGSNAAGGGLVGENGQFGLGGLGSIVNSFATGNVSSAGVSVTIGGLVGQNGPGSTITNSRATGNVTATANVPGQDHGTDCSVAGNCQFVEAGGLVGSNFGTIFGGPVVPTANQACVAGQTCATGAVSVGPNSRGGGLAGMNDGTIVNAFATGNVTGAAGLSNLNGNDNATTLGGLAGQNTGTIVDSHARGNVGALNVANLTVGGLVGENAGSIVRSFAIGQVRAGDNSQAGGLIGNNGGFDNNNCNGCTFSDGHNNLATIINSNASGNVTVGSMSLAGGFSGSGSGTFRDNSATGNVTGGGNSFLGGFIGVTGNDHDSIASILRSTASGSVTSTGSNSALGGFVGANSGTIDTSSSSGPVTGTSSSYLGGFAGINIGAIIDSTTSGSVTAPPSSTNNVMGGFVGLNLGLIDPSSSSGNVVGGQNSIVGGFVGANAAFGNLPAGLIPGSAFPTGTISSDSFGTGSASGGSGSTVGQQVAANRPTSGLPDYPTIIQTCDAAICDALRLGILQGLDTPFPPNPLNPPNPPNPPSPLLLVQDTNTQNAPPVTTAQVVNTQGVTQSLQQQPQPQPTQQPRGADINSPTRLDVGEGRFFYLPPVGETRLVLDEAVLQMSCSDSPQAVNAAMTQVQLVVISSQCLGASNVAIYRVRIGGNQTLARALPALAAHRFVVAAQANYLYQLTQDPAALNTENPQGDVGQYVLGKFRLSDIHRATKGTNVPIAVIDSEIDARHPDLEGVITERFDATESEDQPHAHGTGMAGAISSHRKLLGVAPGARLIAIRAFSSKATTAESTTFNILRGLDHAINSGARIVNMSFAGPRDPTLERALKVAHGKGVVLIAAAGNAGPKSPPLYPAADPSVIAVTATDIDDKLFSGANRGRYIAIAAPGVDILVPAPEGSYQLTTGTSVATAHISGIVALLLERNPRLTPDDVRRILTASAKRLGPNNEFGAGLVDPAKALRLAEPRSVSTTGSVTPR
jgi:filamentous hemagglutinin family protein